MGTITVGQEIFLAGIAYVEFLTMAGVSPDREQLIFLPLQLDQEFLQKKPSSPLKAYSAARLMDIFGY